MNELERPSERLLEVEEVILLLTNHRVAYEGHVSIDLVDPVRVRCYQQQGEPRASYCHMQLLAINVLYFTGR